MRRGYDARIDYKGIMHARRFCMTGYLERLLGPVHASAPSVCNRRHLPIKTTADSECEEDLPTLSGSSMVRGAMHILQATGS